MDILLKKYHGMQSLYEKKTLHLIDTSLWLYFAFLLGIQLISPQKRFIISVWKL